MLGKVPGVRALSEPYSLSDPHFMYMRKEISWAQFKALSLAALRLQLKPDPSGKTKHIVIKLTPFSTSQCEIWHEFMPEAKFVFLTRNMKSTAIVSTFLRFIYISCSRVFFLVSRKDGAESPKQNVCANIP